MSPISTYRRARLPNPGNSGSTRTVAPTPALVWLGGVVRRIAERRQVAALDLTGGGTCADPDYRQ
jgi:hypothetical protein